MADYDAQYALGCGNCRATAAFFWPTLYGGEQYCNYCGALNRMPESPEMVREMKERLERLESSFETLETLANMDRDMLERALRELARRSS